jgi:hypothetical protein
LVRRAAVGIGFVAAAWYLASRLVTTVPSGPKHNPEVNLIWSRPVLVSIVAVLAVVGVASVPLFRALRDRKRLRNGALLLSILITAGAFGAVVAVIRGDLDAADLVLAPKSAEPPNLVLSLAILATLGIAAARLPPVFRRITNMLERPWSAITLVALIGVAAALIWFTASPLWDALSASPWWKPVTAALALFGAPILAISFLLSRHVKAMCSAKPPPGAYGPI